MENLEEKTVKDLRVIAKDLGIKNLKKYNKEQLIIAIKASQTEIIKVNESVEEIKESLVAEGYTEEQIEVNKPEILKAVKEQPQPITKVFASQVEKDGVEYYQYYPTKKTAQKKLSVFRKITSTTEDTVRPKSEVWIEDSEGNKLYSGTSWDKAYSEAIRLRNTVQELKDSTVTVYFDSSIPVPKSYGKTY